ncbi:metal-dependent hydrolase [Flavobacterium sp. HSC-61S13]|uniref:metal-dependent hydrolase n=1 Tax=Flavobacterium sp. HSC-61S13 TaxID=2910963 RepID=UPI00209FC74E|nr:metal-dependent hydrolase [Flavobacterium sp. HSC-61S13]MCP1995835.1 inner membrane protein [Flavobacterium sp. HSC-61S13]
MDSLSQIVLGAAVGNAVLGTKIKNKAVVYGAIAATIPDLDILAGKLLDPIEALGIHRGVSHSFVFAAVLALVLGYGIFRLDRSKGVTFKEGFNLVFLALVTHSFLDVFTTWGTQVLWPWTYSFAFKSIFVVDPLYTIPFAVFLVLSMLEKKDMKRRMRWNNYGILVSSAYLLLTLVLKYFAYIEFKDSLNRRDVSYHSLVVKPTAFNTILWNGIVETDSAYWIGDYSFFDSSDIEYQQYAKNRYLIEHIYAEPIVQKLIDLSEGEYVISKTKGQLYFNDLRFGLLKNDPQDIQFAFSYHLFQNGDGDWKAKEVVKDKRDGLMLIKRLWARIQGQ